MTAATTPQSSSHSTEWEPSSASAALLSDPIAAHNLSDIRFTTVSVSVSVSISVSISIRV